MASMACVLAPTNVCPRGENGFRHVCTITVSSVWTNSQTRLPERFGPILGRAMREMVNSYAKDVGV
jgi:hypothetical protein